jgi:tetratricopeptide (TPR) repeat protein
MCLATSQLALGLSAHHAGRFDEASQIYHNILNQTPEHPDALHLLGVIASERRDYESAASLIARAVQLRPDPAFCGSLGIAFRGQGKLDLAVLCYCEALRADPANGRLLSLLGAALHGLGHHAEAIDALVRSTELLPECGETWCDLGNVYYSAGELDNAANSYRRAISKRRGDYAEAYYNLGVTRTRQDRTQEAMQCYRRALLCKPDHAEAHTNLGLLLHINGDTDAATLHYKEGIRFNPDAVEARYNLAMLLQEENELEQARTCYEQVVARFPKHVETRNNLANTLLGLALPMEAVQHLRTALELKPEYPEAHWNLGIADLTLGEFEEGWKEYEWRFRLPSYSGTTIPGPRWDGSSLEGKRILLQAEQGLGDTIQFIRYGPLVKDLGAQVLFECPTPLLRLLANAQGVDNVAPSFDHLAPFDCYSPLLALPGLLPKSQPPVKMPYLTIPPDLVDHWRHQMARLTCGRKGPRIGLTWSGNPAHRNDRNRSIPLDQLSGFRDIPGIVWVNVQKDFSPVDEQLWPDMIWLGDSLTDFADTAAVMMTLDLVISVDTAVAHLAGALGLPVWTMLPYAADWRWLMDREDSPWYPTMRLFRQSQRRDWSSVISRICNELASHKW